MTTAGTSFASGVVAGVQALRGTFFRPNALFLRLEDDTAGSRLDDADLRRVLVEAQRQQVGSLLWVPHPVTGLGQRRRINVWIRERAPEWRIGWDIGNLDLSLLIALKLQRNWGAELRLLMVVDDPDDADDARAFLEDLVGLARIHDAELVVGTGGFRSFIDDAPPADIDLLGVSEDPRLDDLRAVARATGSSCLFVRDSGTESALA